MSKIDVKYMTDEALATLKANTDEVTGKLIENPPKFRVAESFLPRHFVGT